MKQLGLLVQEGPVSLTISYDDPPETIGTFIHLFEDQELDILQFLQEKLPASISITDVHASIDGRRVKITDNSDFAWACFMHVQSNKRKNINLPIYINKCKETPTATYFTSHAFSGYKDTWV